MGAGWQLPGYELEELVGFGGSGEVWRGREQASGDVVALKRLLSTTQLAREQLRREAALLSSAAGEHVIRVRDVVLADDVAVLVTDYAPGGNLATVLSVRGRLAAPEVVTLVAPLAGALADAHDRGIVHGDVTPANVVFSADGRPLLTDFGVARIIGSPAGVLEATPPYVAPEVLAGAAPGPASDVFALCTIADAALDTATAPPGLHAAIRAGLAAEPDDRPTARDLALDVLRSCAAAPVRLVRAPTVPPAVVTHPVAPPLAEVAPPTTASPPSSSRPASLRIPRRVGAAAIVVVAVIVAVAGGVVWGHRTSSAASVLPAAPPPPTPPPPTPPPPTPPPTARPTAVAMPVWRDVVSRYDALRAQAMQTGDARLLRSIYVDPSAALATDLAALRMLTGHRWSVRGYAITLTNVSVAVVTPDTATLAVTDRISSYRVVDAAGAVVATVPPRATQTFAMQLRRVGDGWRIAAVSR